MVAGGVAAPGGAGVGDLSGGAGLMEAEGVGDDRRRGLEDELAWRGDAGVDEGNPSWCICRDRVA